MKLPLPFSSRIKSQLGNESNAFFDSLNREPVISVRINPGKINSFPGEKVPWCSSGFYLAMRPSFTLDPLLHAGCYYVQDASSMFLEQVFVQLGLSEKKLLMLDACAAPGGKSTHLASLMSHDSFLVSNEVISTRLPVLRENCIKWGNPNVMVTNNDPSAFSSLENLFDVVLVDAPCSGEGLFRKDNDALNEWSESTCGLNAGRQQRILTSLLPALKPGGVLIYSTCTYNPSENEKIIKWLNEKFGLENVPLQVHESWGIKTVQDGCATGYGFYPHRLKGEGLFISVLKKKDEELHAGNIRNRKKRFMPVEKKFAVLKSWILSEYHSLAEKDQLVFALHNDWIEVIEFLSSRLKVVFNGGCIAELKGDKAIPAHELALSLLLNKNAFQAIDLNTASALKYLRKEDFKIDAMHKGYAIVTFEQHPLGFINFLGSRFNNYYPVNWRIRMK